MDCFASIIFFQYNGTVTKNSFMDNSDQPKKPEIQHILEQSDTKKSEVQISPKKKRMKAIWNFLSDILINGVVIIGIVFFVRFALFSPFKVEGASMEPSLHTKEYIIVDKISYRFSDPQRGDIVVLIPPSNTKEYYIKRIIGLPGEKLEFLNGQVLIHNDEYPTGIRIEESYLSEENIRTIFNGEPNIIEIPENHYFVMGDNRRHSNDSRNFGTVHERNLIGQAWIIAWPLDYTGIIEDPEYFL